MKRLVIALLSGLILISLAVVPASAATVGTAFLDTFDSRNTSRWGWGTGSSVTGGALRLADSRSWSTITSVAEYDLKSFSTEVTARPTGSALIMSAQQDSHEIEWYVDGSVAEAYVDGWRVFRATSSATTHRWLRIEAEGYTVAFSSSANGTSWTERGRATLNWAPNRARVALSAGRWSGNASSTGVRLDNASVATAAVAPPSGDPGVSEAAKRYGWGVPTAGSEFTDPAAFYASDDWDVFWGPGYQGNGWQTDEAVKVANGALSITGNSEGDTGAVAYYGAMERYGRWESRIRIPKGDETYHPVALLWPTSGDWPEAGEIDYFESSGPATTNSFSLHHGYGNPFVTDIPIDRGWHTYAVEWTPTTITGYLDGQVYARITDPKLFPSVTMWHSFQLDWMGVAGTTDTVMEVDWLRFYPVN